MPSYTILAPCARCSAPLQLEVPPAAGRERLELAYRLAYLRLFAAYYPCACGSAAPRGPASVVQWPDETPGTGAYYDGAVELPLPDLSLEVAAAARAALAALAAKYGPRPAPASERSRRL